MGFSSFEKLSNLGTMDEYYDEEQDEVLSDVVLDSDDDNDDDQEDQIKNGAFGDMSSLLQELPKRGLSKHFEGKSQSFTSLSNVLCVEDLAKPENPYNKKLKSCKSYGGLLLLSQENKNKSSRNPMNNLKMSSSSSLSTSTRGSCSSLMNIDERRKIIRTTPPHRSTNSNNFSNQTTPLFA